MAWGINDIDLMVLSGTVGGRRGNSDASFFLQFHGVHCGSNPILASDLMNSMDLLGVKKDPLRQSGLARVNMGADPDVPYFFQTFTHFLLPQKLHSRRLE